MKKKTINTVICKKFDEWVETIQDASVRELVKENSLITGGCIASMLLKEKVNDYDVYFTNKKTVLSVAEYYVKQFNELNGDDGWVLDGEVYNKEKDNTGEYKGMKGLNLTPDRVKIIFESKGVAKEHGLIDDDDIIESLPDSPESPEVSEKPKYRPVFMSNNAITLSNGIQIVIRFYGDPEEVHQHYDYIHCTNYWLSKTRQVTLKQPALEALLTKELVYVGSKYPLASVIRTRKFLKRGFTINAGQYLKIAFQISQLDLTNIEVLEDQLIGVDVAYFQILIDALQKHKERKEVEGEPFTLNYDYLSSIIDKIF